MRWRQSSDEQEDAADRVLAWCRSRPRNKPVFKLTGKAGTGKTQVAVQIGLELGAQFVAPTAKAASVLRARGGDNAMTIHSFLYGSPHGVDREGELIWKERSNPLPARLIVADECSMIPERGGRKLVERGVPILVTGDDFQLPAVKGQAFFDGPADFTLQQIHRMAEGSQSLGLATALREGKPIHTIDFDRERLLAADIVICATHKTREYLNTIIRRARGIRGPYPEVGESIICIRNSYPVGVWNGTIWEITDIIEGDDLLGMKLIDDLRTRANVVVPEQCFTCAWRSEDVADDLEAFQYGYAITCHKSQGSEWPRVCVIDELRSPSFKRMASSDPKLSANEYTARWLYTAITRAKEHVDLMDPPP